ncbi:MAG TPA: riboflavin synthase [Nitrososphaera sp.]|jgi:riboflavin synthase|nr:riboflavin synthase [Nitrososphaera sp.]
MFTGIIEGTAAVKSVSKVRNGADTLLRIRLGKLGRGLKTGDSVSVSGACLTVSKLSKGDAEFQMVAETVRRTSLGSLKPSDKVNIERSLKVGERLEGHFVLGHVDGTGTVDDIVEKPTETTIWIQLDDKLAKSVVPKGSIAVDGVSLTLVDIDGEKVSISLIPHTLKMTTLGERSKGDMVNIETDILGKYVMHNLRPT